jgi:hypothetical protein
VGARLGLALRAAGFRVSIWCPRRHALLLTDAVHRRYLYRITRPVRSMEAAVLDAAPDLVVPCDEPATIHLQQLAERASRVPRLAPILRLIESSLCASSEFHRLTHRPYVLEAAAAGGAPVPANAPISSMEELRGWLNVHGFPAYLKADATFGGLGVRRIHNYEEAEVAYRDLAAPPRLSRAIKRMALYRDPTLLEPCLRRRRASISVQRAVAGGDVNSAIFCWRGKVLASLTMQVIHVGYEFGPSTVLRRIHNPQMDRTAEILADQLQLSGFYGLDFILEEQTGIPWLLELNCRATQIPHLALGPGHDLPAAAYAAVTGRRLRARPTVTAEQTIALFPQEWSRDPGSPFLRTAYHDVPWEAPRLVQSFIAPKTDLLLLLSRSYWRNRKRPRVPIEIPIAQEPPQPETAPVQNIK